MIAASLEASLVQRFSRVRFRSEAVYEPHEPFISEAVLRSLARQRMVERLPRIPVDSCTRPRLVHNLPSPNG